MFQGFRLGFRRIGLLAVERTDTGGNLIDLTLPAYNRRNSSQRWEQLVRPHTDHTAFLKEYLRPTDEVNRRRSPEQSPKPLLCRECGKEPLSQIYLPCGHVRECDRCITHRSNEWAKFNQHAFPVCATCGGTIVAHMKIFISH